MKYIIFIFLLAGCEVVDRGQLVPLYECDQEKEDCDVGSE